MPERISFDPEQHIRLPKNEGGGYVEKTAIYYDESMARKEADLVELLVQLKLVHDYNDAIKHISESEERLQISDTDMKSLWDFKGMLANYMYEETPPSINRIRTIYQKNTTADSAIEMLKNIDNKIDALVVVNKYGWILPLLPNRWVGDVDVAITALPKDPINYRILPNKLKNNRDVALAAASSVNFTNGNNQVESIDFIVDQFKHDRLFVLDFIKRNPDQLSGLKRGSNNDSVLKEFYNDKEIILAAVQTYPAAIRYAPDSLINDHDIVMAVVLQQGYLLRMWCPGGGLWEKESIDTSICDDKEVVMAAIKNDPRAIQWASPRLKKYFGSKASSKQK